MISYAKGACWVKVLNNYVGRDTLKLGMKKYFQKFSNKITVLNDLVNCLKEALQETQPNNQIDLIKWTDSWLKQQGPNTLQAEVVTMDN